MNKELSGIIDDARRMLEGNLPKCRLKDGSCDGSCALWVVGSPWTP